MMRGRSGFSSRGVSKRVEAIDLVGLFTTEQRGWWLSLGGVSGGFRTNQGAFRS
jgi:hypothetical protein